MGRPKSRRLWDGEAPSHDQDFSAEDCYDMVMEHAAAVAESQPLSLLYEGGFAMALAERLVSVGVVLRFGGRAANTDYLVHTGTKGLTYLGIDRADATYRDNRIQLAEARFSYELKTVAEFGSGDYAQKSKLHEDVDKVRTERTDLWVLATSADGYRNLRKKGSKTAGLDFLPAAATNGLWIGIEQGTEAALEARVIEVDSAFGKRYVVGVRLTSPPTLTSPNTGG